MAVKTDPTIYHMDEEARLALWKAEPDSSVLGLKTSLIQWCGSFSVFGIVLMVMLHDLRLFFIVMLWIAHLSYTVLICFKMLLILVALIYKQPIHAPRLMSEDELPLYTILVPLRDEVSILPQLIGSLQSLDYPLKKLDIIFLLDADDNVTYRALRTLIPDLSDYHRILKIPSSFPRTKSRVCNVGLHYARGELLTIYDAEDIPEPMQLRHMAQLFSGLDNRTACIQARLNFYNRNDNFLTACFAMEYGWWFDCLLFALQKLKMPVPLGGTSNHFRISALRELHGWDAYNVTEDADLGIRLARHGYEVHMSMMRTWEESPRTMANWVRQRTRWIKGYFQTYKVHMHSLHDLHRDIGWKGFFAVQCFIGLQSYSFLMTPLVWCGWGMHVGTLLDHVMWCNLLFGLGMLWGMAWYICWQQRWRGMRWSQLFFPCYWVLHVIASYRAAFQLLFQPYYWDKTAHGIIDIK